MTGKVNSLLQQSSQTDLKHFRYQLPDDQTNQWWVDIVSDTDPESPANDFANSKSVFVEAKAISPDQARQLIEGWKEEHLRRDQSAVEPPITGFAPYQVTITLETLAIQTRPYLVSFEIDPRLTAEHPVYETTLQLRGEDTTANVSCSPPVTNGTVTLELAGNGLSDEDGPGTTPQVLVSGVTKRSRWQVTVTRSSGNPQFTLRGDIVVN